MGTQVDPAIAEKKRAETLKQVAKLEKEIADTKAKAAMDALSLEGKRQALMSQHIAAAMAFDDARGAALEMQLETGVKNNELYVLELEAQKHLLAIKEQLAGVEAKRAEIAENLKGKKADDAEKAREQLLNKAQSDLSSGQGNLKSLKGSSVSSGIISTSLRSIGGGGNATVTRDPSLQIAKRQDKILEQIAKNTQHAADVEKNQPTQTEF
jgi:hypothetical protein